MWVVHYDRCGSADVLKLRRKSKPHPENHEVLIKVTATTVNKLDLLRRNGSYRSSEVCTLVDGGGYGQWIAVSAYHIIPVPGKLSLADAAALPCAASIVYSHFCLRHKLTRDQKVLIHGGAGGVGSLAIQIAKQYDCKVFATAGSKEKVRCCQELGADICINYKEEDFSERVRYETNGQGVDVILDCVGPSFYDKNISSLARGGKLMISGLDGCFDHILVNFMDLASRDLRVVGLSPCNFRGDDRQAILQGLHKDIWPLIEAGKIKPKVHGVFKFSEAAEAHRLMERKGNTGKILLIPDENFQRII